MWLLIKNIHEKTTTAKTLDRAGFFYHSTVKTNSHKGWQIKNFDEQHFQNHWTKYFEICKVWIYVIKTF